MTATADWRRSEKWLARAEVPIWCVVMRLCDRESLCGCSLPVNVGAMELWDGRVVWNFGDWG